MKIKARTCWQRSEGPIHRSFGLSYAAYIVVPRLALQAMPIWWQKIFLWLCSMLPETPEYVCQRRNERGRFIKDPWANYRRGNISDVLSEDARMKEQAQWKIIAVENVKHNHR